MKPFSILRLRNPSSSGVNPTALSIYNKIVAWWERNEPSGTTMTDAHSNALNGTYSGLTVNQTGLAANLDKSVTYPAGNNYAEVADNALLKPTGDLSCMVWVKRNGTQGNFPKLMWKPGGTKASGQANYLLQQDNFSNGGKVIFRVTISGANYDAMSTTALANATPYFIVGNRAGITSYIYINGVQEGTATIPNSALSTATDTLRFGYHGSAGDPWVGSQDQAALFNDDLSSAEIAYLYNGGAGISYATLKAAAGF
jgi:hypothetical protein